MGILISSLISKKRTSRGFLFEQCTDNNKKDSCSLCDGRREWEITLHNYFPPSLGLYLKKDPEFFTLGCAGDTLVLTGRELMCSPA